jgi:uncharacterized protein
MSRTLCRVLVVSLLIGSLAAVARAYPEAVAPVIKDEGKFFSDETRQKADNEIRDIFREYGKDLQIETFPTPPADEAKDVNLKDRKERDKFFEKWARERARHDVVDGIYILICKEPRHLQVEVGNETQKKAFTLEDRNELRELLLEKFKKQKYDDGLLEAVEFVGKKLKAHGVRAKDSKTGAGAAVPTNVGVGFMEGLGGLLCFGLIVIAVVWLIIGLFRALSGMGGGYRSGYGPGYGGGYGGGGGGGGFFSSLMGGMFGAAAGNWMYDSFFRGGGGQSWGAGQGGYRNTGGDSSANAGSRPDTDYSGTGGDFGDDSGGSGGGGGDFGGNDGGGGGGDFGGGGGDFGGGGDSGGGGGGGGGDF